MEIKILQCVLQARVYHRHMQRNQSALQYLHSTCNMRFIPPPCVQSPTYIFCQICQFLQLRFTSEVVNYAWSLFPPTVFLKQVASIQLVERVACMLFFYLCCHNKSCRMSQHMACVKLWEGDRKASNFESQFLDRFFPSDLVRWDIKCLIPCEALQPIKRATEVLAHSAN